MSSSELRDLRVFVVHNPDKLLNNIRHYTRRRYA